jgi:hypothetical protein
MLHRFPALAVGAAALVAASASPAFAGLVPVEFSGGSGSPLTITLPQPITYTVTNDTPTIGVVFVFRNVGNVTGAGVGGVSGTLGYTSNGGAANALNTVTSDNSNDLSFFKNGNFVNATLGDVLVASGSGTTGFVVAGAAPPSGLYDAIVTDSALVQLGAGFVPEPAAGLALVAAFGLALSRTRSRARHTN